jgi:hypothetical protein
MKSARSKIVGALVALFLGRVENVEAGRLQDEPELEKSVFLYYRYKKLEAVRIE